MYGEVSLFFGTSNRKAKRKEIIVEEEFNWYICENDFEEEENNSERERRRRRSIGDYSISLCTSDEEEYETESDRTDISNLIVDGSSVGTGDSGSADGSVKGIVGGNGENIYNHFWEAFPGAFRGFRAVICSTIFPVDTTRCFGAESLLRKIISKGKKCYFSVASYHPFTCPQCNGPHFHWWHDCKWYNNGCKCTNLPTGKRNGVQHRTNGKSTAPYCHAILLYANKEQRQCHFVKIGARNWSVPLSVQAIQYEGCHWSSIHGTVPSVIDERTDQLRRDESVVGCGTSASTSSKAVPSGGRSSGKHLPTEIETFIYNNPVYPIKNVIKTRAWMQSGFKYLMPSDKNFKRALRAQQLTIYCWKYSDFINYYHTLLQNFGVSSLYFQRGNILGKDFYFSIEESYAKILEIVEFQISNFSTDIEAFFSDVYSIVTKRLPKKNTIYVVGEASSGKNFLFDSLLAFFLNVGHLANFNKNVGFPLNDCKERNLILWNEPNFCPSSEDTLKTILGGDICPANIKFEDYDSIARTPCIVLSNKDVFHVQSNEPFKERFISYLNWRTLPFKKVYKKPNPLVWIYIFHIHNIHPVDKEIFDKIKEL